MGGRCTCDDRRAQEDTRRIVSSIVLDSGALIALERGSRRIQALIEQIRARGLTVLIPAGVVAEVWRDGARQARIAKLLSAPETRVVALDEARARAIGVLLGSKSRDNVVDASVVLCARERGTNVTVLTSDTKDLRAIDPNLPIVPI